MAERDSRFPLGAAEDGKEFQWILDTYAECLKAVRSATIRWYMEGKLITFWQLYFYRIIDGKRTGGDLVSVKDPSSSIDFAIDEAKFLLKNNQFPVCGKADLCVIKTQDGNLVREVHANT
jgi:hypothetical protein